MLLYNEGQSAISKITDEFVLFPSLFCHVFLIVFSSVCVCKATLRARNTVQKNHISAPFTHLLQTNEMQELQLLTIHENVLKLGFRGYVSI